ncbi:MAG TPA: LOG family protein, partial [Rhizobacter sp.]|nr:LOG family protein [Rhizobacter sp.]
TWRQLGYHDKPVGLLNVDGYYDRLLSFMSQAVADGFVPPAQQLLLQAGSEPAELLDRLGAQALVATSPDDYRRI